MFHGRKKKETRFGLNKRGFSLVEILIAIGILVLITVPLAMNMISSSQINSKAKQTAASSDLTTAIIEMLQTVDLSDVLTDVNGYSADEHGEEFKYTLTGSALKNYHIGKKFEAVVNDSGQYVPVTNPEELIQDIKSSIAIRQTGEVTRAYFVGQNSGKYAFVLSEVETDEMNVDIVATIVPEQKFDIVNIVSMAQSEVIHTKQKQDEHRAVASQFKAAHDKYSALNDSSESKSIDWFLNNMTRTINVTIKQDQLTDATTIVIEAVYAVDLDDLKDADKIIKKTLGSFSTNSTAEFARGVYVYYYPLMDCGTTIRDHFVINNQNELAAPVYLIALNNDTALDYSTITNYHPTIKVNELSDVVYQDVARTPVCSNIPNDLWDKTLYPVGREFNIKTLGNTSEQQTLYSMQIQVYRHRDASFDEENVFTPRDKDLLIETKGSFIDTSEILDIDSDTTTGLTPTEPGVAHAATYSNLIYNGEEQRGVYGTNVVWSGTTKATNANSYTAKATPIHGYRWADGTNGTKTFIWTIHRAVGAEVFVTNATYNACYIECVSGQNVILSGILNAYDAGVYTAYAKPTDNYMWDDGTYGVKSFKWRIYERQLTVQWETGLGKDVWVYDGNSHSGSYTFTGVVDGDSCDIFVSSNQIKEVGTKIAKVTGVSNTNYKLIGELEHILKVYSQSSASIQLVSTNLTYDGQVQSVISSSKGVSISGQSSGKDAGDYSFIASPKNGYTWDDGTTLPRTYRWTIHQRQVDLVWGTSTWIYDGATHSTTCFASNIVDGDIVNVTLSNNSIKNVGTVTATATVLTNANYCISSASSTTCNLTVQRAPLARYQKYNFEYDGFVHTGVTGQYVTMSGTTSSSEVAFNSDGTVGHHVAQVTPLPNYAWEDGTTDTKSVYWFIAPLADAWYDWSNMQYTGQKVQGVYGRNVTHTGNIDGTTIGKYVAYLTPIANHTWKDTGSAEQRTVEWNIEQTTFAIPAFANPESTNSESYELTYNGEEQSPLFTASSLHDGYTLSGATSATNVGTYTVTASLRDKDQSQWADGTTYDKTLTWKIVPKEISIAFNENTWVFDGVQHTGTARIIGGLCGEDSCDLYYTDNARTIAGTQQFTVSGVSNVNYKLPDSGVVGTVTINKRTVGITWGTLTWTYDKTEKTAAATVTNVISEYACSFTYESNKRTNAGSQTAKIIGVTNSNYQLPSTNLSATMTITPKTVGISWGTTTWTYDNQQHTVTPTATNFISGDSVSFAVTNASRTDAGTQTVTITAINNNNYQLPTSGLTNTLTIHQKEITLQWGVRIHKWDGTEKTVTAAIWEGLISGTQCKLTLSNNKRTNIGSQTITASIDNPNYVIKNPTEILEIIKADGHIVAPKARDLTYNGNYQNLVTAGSTNYGSVYYSTSSSGPWSTSIPTGKNAGMHTVYYYSSGDSNHNSTAVKSITVNIDHLRDASVSTWDATYPNYGGSSGTNTTKVSGSESSNTVGWHDVTYKPKTNHAWKKDGTTGNKTFSYRVSPGTAEVHYKPQVTGQKASDGYYHYYALTSSNGVEITGDISYMSIASSTGKKFIFYATPLDGYKWPDGTTGQKTYEWQIVS